MKTLKVGCLWAAQAQRDRRFTYDDVQHRCRGVGRIVGGWAVYHTSILAEATRGPVERERGWFESRERPPVWSERGRNQVKERERVRTLLTRHSSTTVPLVRLRPREQIFVLTWGPVPSCKAYRLQQRERSVDRQTDCPSAIKLWAVTLTRPTLIFDWFFSRIFINWISFPW
jgi:hypothetical protein